VKSARIVKVKEPLKVEQVDKPSSRGPQVIVKVQACGVCHSDIHLWEGGYEGPGGKFLKTTDRGISYPLTPGHEIAGTVDSVGEEVKGFSGGEKVIVYPWIGEGLCPACRSGEENLCDDPQSIGLYQDGGYSQYVLVPSYRYLVPISDGLDMQAASTLSCSALTAYGAIKNVSQGPQDNVVVVGVGGLGLMAIQLAKAVTGSRIIAMDLDDEILQAAKDNGTDAVINSKKDDNPAQTVKELTEGKGADAVMDFVNSSTTATANMKMLLRRAKVTFVGLFGGELKVNLIEMPTKAYSLLGSYTRSPLDLVELVSLAEQGVIKPVITDRFPLEDATEGLSKLKRGEIIGRGVLVP
jgi:alcohol dehydrogenase, propanol-preferring